MSKLNVDNIENRLGTGGPQLPGATFTDNIVGTAASFTGIVTATSFIGDLTGDATGLTGNPTISVTDITATGNVSIAGTLTYEDVTNVDSIGIITAQSGIDVTGGGINVTGVSTFNNNTLHVDNAKAVFGGGSDLQIYHTGSLSYISDQGPGALRIIGNQIRIRNAGDTEELATFTENGSVELYYDNDKKFETTGAGVTVTGTVSDSIGPLRRLGITSVSATGNLSANDAGKILRSTGTITLTIPSGTFTAGDMISIFNVGIGTITIAQGSSTTLYNSADASTGNRTLDAKGLATIACTASNEFIVSGSQLS